MPRKKLVNLRWGAKKTTARTPRIRVKTWGRNGGKKKVCPVQDSSDSTVSSLSSDEEHPHDPLAGPEPTSDVITGENDGVDLLPDDNLSQASLQSDVHSPRSDLLNETFNWRTMDLNLSSNDTVYSQQSIQDRDSIHESTSNIISDGEYDVNNNNVNESDGDEEEGYEDNDVEDVIEENDGDDEEGYEDNDVEGVIDDNDGDASQQDEDDFSSTDEHDDVHLSTVEDLAREWELIRYGKNCSNAVSNDFLQFAWKNAECISRLKQEEGKDKINLKYLRGKVIQESLPEILMDFIFHDKHLPKEDQEHHPVLAYGCTVMPRKRYPPERYELISQVCRIHPSDIKRLHLLSSNCHREADYLEIQISVDGVNESNSSSRSLEIVSIKFKGCNDIYPICISRPEVHRKVSLKENFNIYLSTIVKQLGEAGLTIDKLVVDAPERAAIRQQKQHGGYHSCDLCVCNPENLKIPGKRGSKLVVKFTKSVNDVISIINSSAVTHEISKSFQANAYSAPTCEMRNGGHMNRLWYGRSRLWKPDKSATASWASLSSSMHPASTS